MSSEIKRAGNGAAGRMELGTLTIYFSYDTVIALKSGNVAVQTDKYFSVTTEKHRHELGCSDFQRIHDEEFTTLLAAITLR